MQVVVTMELHAGIDNVVSEQKSMMMTILVRKLGPYCGWMELICVLVMRRSLQRSAANV